MSHGQQCSCTLCTIGKKMGMIKTPHDDAHHTHHHTCATCGAPVGDDGICHVCAAKK